jgi:hypothetical protein
MTGARGLKGGWQVIDAQAKCKELGGKVYLGICLKSQRLDSDADTVPFKCNAYQVLRACLWLCSCLMDLPVHAL